MSPENQNPKTQILLATVGLIGTLGVALLGNWEKIMPQPEAVPDSSSSSSASSPATPGESSPIGANFSPTPRERTSTDSFKKALGLEETTTTLVANAIASEEDWNKIVLNWQGAIQLMEQVPASDENHLKAVQKLREYQNQLRYAEALKSGSTAANLTQAATINTVSPAAWRKIEGLWKQAIAKLNAIQSDDPIYSSINIESKIEEYETNQGYAKKAELLAPLLQAVRKAQEAGNSAQNAKSIEDWTRIAGLWGEAIESMQSVSPESGQTQDARRKKIQEYQTNQTYALLQAQQQAVNP